MNTRSDAIFLIDSNALRSNTIPTTIRTKSNIANAINCFNKLDMPKNFTKTSELRNIINRLIKVEEELDNIVEYINKKIKDFETAEKRAQTMAKSLNTQDLTKTFNITPIYLPEGMNNGNVIPFSNEYLQTLYDKTMAKVYTVYEKKHFEYGRVINLELQIKEIGGDAIQSIVYDGKNVYLSIGMKEIEKDINGFPKQDKNGNKIKKDCGVIIAKYDFEKKELEVLIKNTWKVLGENRAKHGESIAYNNDVGNILIKNYKKDESSVFELNLNTKVITQYKIPQYYRDIAYDKNNKQLLGFIQNNKTVTFMERSESEKRYKEMCTITLKNNGEKFNNVQGMSCDGKYIYLYDSNHEDKMPKEEWKVHKFKYDGTKVGEYFVSDKENEIKYNEIGFKHREVESGYIDNYNNSYICGPYSIVEITNYKSNSYSTLLVSNKKQ
ncbi:MAG: hypothetical protein IJK18_03035 [Clostridia bacterium]|nr:hypothetical protein [Clostridia bacterium]